LQAVAETFLSINGGTVQANQEFIDFPGYKEYGKMYIEKMVADQSKWVLVRVEQASTSTHECNNPESREYHSETCRFAREIWRGFREIEEAKDGKPLIEKIE
jgi:hypothetical protein